MNVHGAFFPSFPGVHAARREQPRLGVERPILGVEDHDMPGSVPQLRTLGVLAKEVERPLSQVEYIVRTRGIAPCAKAGTLRLFDARAVEAVRVAIREMEEREGVSCG
jgi:hypothetical protein